jgi:L-xylulokinase
MGEGSPLILGLDAGNTVVKAVLFDIGGNEIAQSRRNCASVHSRLGYVERSMPELWSNASAVIKECLAKANAKPSAIAAIGCAGHGNGLYLLDRAGAPLLAIQSLDNRAASVAEALCGDGNGRKLHAISRATAVQDQAPSANTRISPISFAVTASGAVVSVCVPTANWY